MKYICIINDTHNAIAMVLDIKDLQKMFESLEEIFSNRTDSRDLRID